MTRLTEQAHATVAATVERGDVVVDATAGNGHDTCFLADCVGDSGTVYAFDIQLRALLGTAARLYDHRLQNVVLFHASHDKMLSVIPARHRGRCAAIMMNLGYLPGGDKSIVTQADSTIIGIDSALQLLRPQGVLSVMAYPGHPGGAAETAAVERSLRNLAESKFHVREILPQNSRVRSVPRLFIVTNIECQHGMIQES